MQARSSLKCKGRSGEGRKKKIKTKLRRRKHEAVTGEPSGARRFAPAPRRHPIQVLRHTTSDLEKNASECQRTPPEPKHAGVGASVLLGLNNRCTPPPPTDSLNSLMRSLAHSQKYFYSVCCFFFFFVNYLHAAIRLPPC